MTDLGKEEMLEDLKEDARNSDESLDRPQRPKPLIAKQRRSLNL
jgi:hypothetical protein